MDDHKRSDKIWFYNIGLGGKDEKANHFGWKMRTFSSLLKQLGHVNVSHQLNREVIILHSFYIDRNRYHGRNFSAENGGDDSQILSWAMQKLLYLAILCPMSRQSCNI